MLDPQTEIVRTDLLDQGEMVRHDSERLACIVITCAERARSRTLTAYTPSFITKPGQDYSNERTANSTMLPLDILILAAGSARV